MIGYVNTAVGVFSWIFLEKLLEIAWKFPIRFFCSSLKLLCTSSTVGK